MKETPTTSRTPDKILRDEAISYLRQYFSTAQVADIVKVSPRRVRQITSSRNPMRLSNDELAEAIHITASPAISISKSKQLSIQRHYKRLAERYDDADTCLQLVAEATYSGDLPSETTDAKRKENAEAGFRQWLAICREVISNGLD